MEKLRDLIHDFTDVILAISIAVVMIAVVALNLGNWFDFGTTALASPPPPVEVEEPIVANEDEVEPEEEDPVEADEPQENNETPSAPPISVVEIKRITIPSGTPGAGVGRILRENGLIDDVPAFIKTAEDLNLALKLKSGTFDIPTNATLEEMVRIISK